MAFRVLSERERPVSLESVFFSGSFLTAFSGFCAGALDFGAASLSLFAFGGRPRRFGCSGSLGFSSAFFGASDCFSGFSAFCRGQAFSPPGATARSSAFFSFIIFSEVIDGNLRVLYLRFRLFFPAPGKRKPSPALLGGVVGVSLPGPVSVTGCSGVFVVLSSAISIYLLFFGMKKGAQLFSQAPVGSSSFLRHDTKIPPVVSFGRYFV